MRIFKAMTVGAVLGLTLILASCSASGEAGGSGAIKTDEGSAGGSLSGSGAGSVGDSGASGSGSLSGSGSIR